MILNPGDTVLVAHRRIFEQDGARYFLGTVEEYESGIARVTGYTFVRESFVGRVFRKDDLRTKIVAILSGTLIVYRLPEHLAIDKLHFVYAEGKLIVTDDAGFEMNLEERARSN